MDNFRRTTLDSAGYVAYDAVTFEALDFSGNHNLLVRYAAEGVNPESAAITLVFTANPVAPAAPVVTRDDIYNTVTGMTTAMEFSYDGAPYVIYDPTGTLNFDWIDIAYGGIKGNHTLLVRYAAVGVTPASLPTTLIFTAP